ncbi:MAG TPA: ABC transporter substrate-binding protein [Xanthobacteraceae bacterium]|nr:ABC transporter substrate-binding protein [Xanthobacteraceae bacterium]
MKRRQFITLLGGAAAWPLAARAQKREKMRRIGVLTALPSDDPEGMARIGAFLQELQELGWTDGRNVRIDYRWGADDTERIRAERIRKYVVELVELAPDVVLVNGASSLRPLQEATRTVPIVFVQITDPVGGGFIDSLARPGGNTTGFALYEYGTSAKWLELLKEIAPGVTRVAVLRDAVTAQGAAQFGVIQSVASSLGGVELRPLNVRDAGEIERGVSAFARGGNGGLIVTTGAYAFVHRKLIITLAARYRLPAVYPYRSSVTAGGLISYGSDSIDAYRRAASYVDRILRGEKPADLPVQAPTKYELVINLKTARALGIEMPATVLARADEVIE